MRVFQALGAANVLAITVTMLVVYAAFSLSGCVTPKVTAKQPEPHACPVPEEDHLYCGCIAACGEHGPPTLIGMPEDACRNPPPGCRALPIFCDRAVVDEVPNPGPGEPVPSVPLETPSDVESTGQGPRIYEL